MNCRDFQEMIDSYLSDELLTETNHGVLRHMENCFDCRKVIEARREVRIRLRSAMINAPQYQIGKNFTHNLQTQLKFEALKNQKAHTGSTFGFSSWITAVAGLLLVFTLGFFLVGNIGNDQSQIIAEDIYTTNEVPKDHIVNIAFGDHQFCAVEHQQDNPVKFVSTPVKYDDVDKVAMPQLKDILSNCTLKQSHTCEYSGIKFTHLIIDKNNEILSVMLTDRKEADKFSEDISSFSSKKYELARFDVDETSVFVVSGLNKQTNNLVAKTLYEPLQKHLTKERRFQTTSLVLK